MKEVRLLFRASGVGSCTAILPFSRTSKLYRDCSSIYYLCSTFSALVQRFCAPSLRTQHGISTQALQPHFPTTGKLLFQLCWYFLHSNLKLLRSNGKYIYIFMQRLFSHIHLKKLKPKITSRCTINK